MALKAQFLTMESSGEVFEIKTVTCRHYPEHTLRRQLKTWLFKKSFSDIFSDTGCIMTFSL